MHTAPRGIYSDWWDLMSEMDREMFDAGFIAELGTVSAQFYASCLETLPQTADNRLIAIELTGRFMQSVYNSMVTGDEENRT